MILFNLIFSQNITQAISPFSFFANNTERVKLLNSSKESKEVSLLAYTVNDLNCLSKSQYDLSKQKLINYSTAKNLVNNLWQQAIFLYIPNRSSDKYLAQLNSLKTHRNKFVNKMLVAHFSKSLNDYSISSSYSSKLSDIQSCSIVQYMWMKDLYIVFKNFFTLFDGLFKTNGVKDYFNDIKILFNRDLNFNHFPIYAVCNNLGQILISEPPQKANFNSHSIDSLSGNSNFMHMYESWFFINFEDAKEYMRHIKYYYGLSDNSKVLKIFVCNLETFYKISHKYNRYLALRLVPDLTEVGRLLNKYRYYRHISFHEKQNQGADYFQGQPIYTVRYNDKNQAESSFVYKVMSGQKQKLFGAVFTNYDTALRVWLKLVQNSNTSKALNKPHLVVYNLESFLQDRAYSISKRDQNLILIPSSSSYHYALKEHLKNKTGIIHSNFVDSFLFCQLWAKRILWSLTGKQPG